MKVLALDTTTRVGSVALIDGDRVLDERYGDGTRSHAERLPEELLAVATANGVAVTEIDVFAVASGPGSFTGLRIGIATIQGLALVARRRVVAVSALDALAHMASPDLDPGATVAVWMDAHRHEVFASLYRVTSAPDFGPARVTELDVARVDDPQSVLARWRELLTDHRAAFIGDGAALYADRIASAYPAATILEARALAGTIGRLADARSGSGGAVDPAAIRPLYVRRPDAEIDREKRAFTTMDTKDTKEETNRT